MKNMKKPSQEDMEKCINIRRKSKQGEYISYDDNSFCYSLWKKFPKWYASINKDVFNLTVPFGSNVKLR